MTARILLALIERYSPLRRSVARALLWKLGKDYDWSLPKTTAELTVEAWLLDLSDGTHDRQQRKAPSR